MPLAMTIADARRLQEADLAVDDDAVAQAEQEAADAARLLDSLERQAVEADKAPKSGAAVLEQRQLAEFARKRADRTRQRAEQAKAARRLFDLAQVGKDVEAIAAAAATPGQSITAAVQKIADGQAELIRLCADHDQKVKAVMDRAQALNAEPPAPNGPRASSAHVTVLRPGPGTAAGIQSGSAVVRTVGKKAAAEAAQLAASGDADGALRRLHAARHVDPPKRADRYYLTANGRVEGISGDTPTARNMAANAAKGEMRELAPDEVDAYIDGRFHGHQGQA